MLAHVLVWKLKTWHNIIAVGFKEDNMQEINQVQRIGRKYELSQIKREDTFKQGRVPCVIHKTR